MSAKQPTYVEGSESSVRRKCRFTLRRAMERGPAKNRLQKLMPSMPCINLSPRSKRPGHFESTVASCNHRYSPLSGLLVVHEMSAKQPTYVEGSESSVRRKCRFTLRRAMERGPAKNRLQKLMPSMPCINLSPRSKRPGHFESTVATSEAVTRGFGLERYDALQTHHKGEPQFHLSSLPH